MSRFPHRILFALLACTATVAVSTVAQASPIVNIALLARPSGTTSAFSSTIASPTAGSTWDYMVTITLLTPTSPIANANLTTAVAGYNTSTPSLLTGDGWGSVAYLLRESAAAASQVTFNYANDGNAARYADYPDFVARPELAGPSNDYRTTNGVTGTTVWRPISPASAGFTSPVTVQYNLTGTNAGTPVARAGAGNDTSATPVPIMDMGNTTATASFLGRTGGNVGVISTNTPTQGLVVGNGVLTLASVGTGATSSTISPTWEGMQTTTTLIVLRYRNGAAAQVNALLTVGAQQNGTGGFANGTNAADPVFSVTPLTITTAATGPVNGLYTLTASSGAASIMKGDTTSVSALLNNTGTTGANNANLDFTALSSSITTGNGTLGTLTTGAPTNGSNVAVQTSSTNSSYTLKGLDYGNVIATTAVTSVINNANNPATAPTNNTTNATVTVNVGVAVPVSGGVTNAGLTTFGTAITSSPLLINTLYGSGSQTAKFGTKSNGTGTNGIATSAELLDGQTGGNRTLRMAWRTRATNEMPGTVVSPPGPVYGVKSDVVQLTGMAADGSQSTDPTSHVVADKFVLQMSVSDAAFGGSHAALQTAIANGFLYLGWLDDTTATTSTHGGLPLWRNAVAGDFANFTANPDNLKGVINSYASYFAGTTGVGGIGKTGGTSRIGDWGVQDLGSGNGAVVWAVLDHNSIFAAVPEPSSIVMLGFGLLGLVTMVRRRRTAVVA